MICELYIHKALLGGKKVHNFEIQLAVCRWLVSLNPQIQSLWAQSFRSLQAQVQSCLELHSCRPAVVVLLSALRF